jgi:hypothetical protein
LNLNSGMLQHSLLGCSDMPANFGVLHGARDPGRGCQGPPRTFYGPQGRCRRQAILASRHVDQVGVTAIMSAFVAAMRMIDAGLDTGIG